MKNQTTKTTKTVKTAKVTGRRPLAKLEVPTTPDPMAEFGPNAKFPYGVKITTPVAGNQYERFKTAKERDARLKNLANDGVVEPVDYKKTTAPKTPKAAKAPKAAKTSKSAAPKKTAAKKTPKAEKTPAEPVVKLLSKGVFYFPKAATELLRGLPYLLVETKGKKVTLTPTKSAKDTQEVRHNQIGVSKVLAEIGWDKQTKDLPIKVAGDSLIVEVR